MGPPSSAHQDGRQMPGHAATTDTEEVRWAQDRQDISPRHSQPRSPTPCSVTGASTTGKDLGGLPFSMLATHTRPGTHNAPDVQDTSARR